MELPSIEHAEVEGKRVLVRVDYNVHYDELGRIASDKKLHDSLPTLHYLIQKGAKVILLTHLGRPKEHFEHKFRTCAVARHLQELLEKPVQKIDNCIGPEVEETIARMQPSDVLLLENVRFYEFEKSKHAHEHEYFAQRLAALADLYVNEAFSNSHREHASMVGVPKYLPSYAGFNVLHEVRTIKSAIDTPERPFISIIGGVKADKVNTIKHMLEKADYVLMGGALAYLILKQRGIPVGRTKLDEEGLTEEFKALVHHPKLVLPIDAVVAESDREDAPTYTVPLDQIGDMHVFDIGPATIEHYRSIIRSAKTVVWNGPVGFFEREAYAQGTRALAEAIALSKVVSIIGGGDSSAAVELFGFSDQMTMVSSGGGASLKLFSGEELPALTVLRK